MKVNQSFLFLDFLDFLYSTSNGVNNHSHDCFALTLLFIKTIDIYNSAPGQRQATWLVFHKLILLKRNKECPEIHW